MKAEALRIKARVYYTGDMANESGYGQIEIRHAPTHYTPEAVSIRLDDGRWFKMLPINAFAPGAGRRFWPLAEWKEQERMALAAFMRREKTNLPEIPVSWNVK